MTWPVMILKKQYTNGGRGTGWGRAAGRDCPLFPDPDLRKRLEVLVWVRFAVAPAIVLGALFASYGVGISELNISGLYILAAALIFCNMLAYLALRARSRAVEEGATSGRSLEWVLHFSVATDFLLLAVAVWLVGGPFSPFKAFFVFNVIVASMLLSRRAAFCHAALAFVLLAGLVIGTWRGWLPGHYPAGAVAAAPDLSGAYVTTVLTVQGLLILLTALLTTHLMRALHASARRLARSNQELENVSQLRRDFLQIALHNLRSPVGAVSMHLSNLTHGYGGPLTEEQRSWLDRSLQRLRDLTRFLNDLEYLAALETGDLERHVEDVDIRDIVGDVAEEYRELAEDARHTLTVSTGEKAASVPGIPRLIREALANYITNAVKYTPRGGRIEMRIVSTPDTVSVEVTDNGIGISEANQKRLFREMARIPCTDPALGEVAGSGLGLYIVRRIAEIHGATIGVRSREGAGSTFILTFSKGKSLAGNTKIGV